MTLSIGIIIPNHNYGHLLPRLLASIRDQGLALHEIIVCDDGSNDDSLRIAESWRDRLPVRRFEVLALPRDGRPGAVRNRGLARAAADLLVCLDPDDFILHGFLAACAEAIVKGADIAYTDYIHREAGTDRVVNLPDFDPDLLRTQNILLSSAMFRRTVWEASPGWRTNTLYEDWDYWLQAASRGFRFTRVARPLYVYETRPDNFSARASANDARAKAILVRNNHAFFPSETREWAEAVLRREPWAYPFGRGLIPRPRDVASLREIAAQAARVRT